GKYRYARWLMTIVATIAPYPTSSTASTRSSAVMSGLPLDAGEFRPAGQEPARARGRRGLRVDSQQRLGARRAEEQPGVVAEDQLESVARVHAGDLLARHRARRRGDQALQRRLGRRVMRVDPRVGRGA